MRKIVLTAATAVLGLGMAAPALAQDGPPTNSPDRAFNGPRAGVLLGYDKLQPGSTDGSSIRGDRGADGLTYGGDIGYDIDNGGRFVFGVEGEVTGSTSKVTNNPVDAAALGYGRVKAGRDFYAGARVGYKLQPTTLLYVKGGYTNARLDLTANNGTVTTGQHYTLDGYRVGAGVEQAITARTYAKLEYRYSNYGNARLEFANGANTNNFSVDTDRHQVLAGVGFRF
ncbi:outer membrane protein [Sphingomonas sp. PAMC 26621]|uniref:outer membrane protein n=1 Tax=Sphingomonas sp. PAMC 26621 TaxID=1112213 RepID=UPI000287BF3D|nr:outer membrane beta-barrel protein [Sphingomonas sp. PAMC 26621]